MLPTPALWRRSPRILSEQLTPVPTPAALLLEPGETGIPGPVCGAAARALLDLPPCPPPAPPWLAPHQVPAFVRLVGILERYGGAVLADAAGMGKSYVALAIAAAYPATLLVVPAVLDSQWRALCDQLGVAARIQSTESLSHRALDPARRPSFVVVDEAHRFRNPDTERYRALARYLVGVRTLFLTATPVHNRLADLLHLLRLFLRDDALAALGLPSLRLAASGRIDSKSCVAAALGRLVVARSRGRARAGYAESTLRLAFPARGRHLTIEAAPGPPGTVAELVQGIDGLQGHAAPLLKLTLLRRLASSLAALRWSLERYAAFLELAAESDRRLEAKDFQRCFARTDDGDLQLALLPVLLKASAPVASDLNERERVRALLALCGEAENPKAEALVEVLSSRTAAKTIVFTDAAATLRDLRRRLCGRFRIAAVAGASAWLGRERAGREEALRCFAPLAQGGGAPSPPEALTADVLLATDLVGEGLSLQDASRVVHYDIPWSPARLAQRVGRIDRLGSRHASIETATFVPPPPLAGALALERRLADKIEAQLVAGAAEVETLTGRLERETGPESPFDWCDRLQRLAGGGPEQGDRIPAGVVAAVREGPRATVLVVRLGPNLTEVIVVADEARPDPASATALLERAAVGTPAPPDRERLREAILAATPLVQERIAAIEAGRWRVVDRECLGRRLIPYTLTAARRAARRGNGTALARLDLLVSRLSTGMSAGEELLLEDLLRRRRALSIADLVAWDAGLPPAAARLEPPRPELLAAVMLGALG